MYSSLQTSLKVGINPCCDAFLPRNAEDPLIWAISCYGRHVGSFSKIFLFSWLSQPMKTRSSHTIFGWYTNETFTLFRQGENTNPRNREMDLHLRLGRWKAIGWSLREVFPMFYDIRCFIHTPPFFEFRSSMDDVVPLFTHLLKSFCLWRNAVNLSCKLNRHKKFNRQANNSLILANDKWQKGLFVIIEGGKREEQFLNRGFLTVLSERKTDVICCN